jgi:hypothetical protein
MQMWFKSIASANDRADVDNSPLNFSNLVDSVRYGNFHQRLPPTFSKKQRWKKAHKSPITNTRPQAKETKNKHSHHKQASIARTKTTARRDMGQQFRKQKRRLSLVGRGSTS